MDRSRPVHPDETFCQLYGSASLKFVANGSIDTLFHEETMEISANEMALSESNPNRVMPKKNLLVRVMRIPKEL
jgi:hypothetical protein